MAEEHRKRTRQFKVSLYDKELEWLTQKAFDANMSKSEFVRKIIMYGSAKEKTNFSREDAAKICYELNRIGNNINQLAYQANIRGNVTRNDFEVMKDEFANLLTEFDEWTSN